MPVIGITGGIGTGKSTVAELFRDGGAEVYSADEAAREITMPGSPALIEIAGQFGQQFIRPDGTLDRAALGAYVFSNPDARRKLEAITHPRIRERLRQQIEASRRRKPASLVAVEVPLLYEGAMQDWFDAVVVVTSSKESQVARLKAKGFSEEDAELRIGAQMPLDEKAARADFIITNNGSREELRTSVEKLLRQLMKSP